MNAFRSWITGRRKIARSTTARLVDDLEAQRKTVEEGFFCGASPARRMAAAGALGSMKAIIAQLKKNSRLDCSVKGTQAEDLETYFIKKKARIQK